MRERWEAPSSSGATPTNVVVRQLVVAPQAERPWVHPNLRLRYGRALQHCVGDELRSDPGALTAWREYWDGSRDIEVLRRLYAGGQVTAQGGRRQALAYTYFLQWRHLRQTVWALRRLINEHSVLGSEKLRILSLGGGPASEALAVWMILAEESHGQRVECFTVDHNRPILEVGEILLRETGANELVEHTAFTSADDPILLERLQDGAESRSPLVVITNHVFKQETVDYRTLAVWGDLVERGLAEEGMLVSVEAWPTPAKLAKFADNGQDDWERWTRYYGFGGRDRLMARIAHYGTGVAEEEVRTELSSESANLEPVGGDLWRRSSATMAICNRVARLRRT